jgi:hypothetical protein
MALSAPKGSFQELLSTVVDTVNGWFNVSFGSLIHGEDEAKDVLGTITKPVASATYSPLRSISMGSVITAVPSAAPAAVLSVYATNANAAVRYFQIHNRATALSGGEAPLMSYPIPAGTANNPGVLTLSTAHFAPTSYLSTGLVWAVSTRCRTRPPRP